MDPITVRSFEGIFRRALLPLHGEGEVRALTRAVFSGKLNIPVPALDPDRLLTPPEAQELSGILQRLVAGEPVQYVLGHVHFMGLRLAVDARVLIPRPETEELVDLIKHRIPYRPACIVDVGTGSGCIALALKQAFPDAAVTGIDASEGALDVARSNSKVNGLEVQWVQLDALGVELMPFLHRQAQEAPTLIVSNPPYVPLGDKASMQSQVLDHEPHLALFVDDGDPQRFYRAIARAAAGALLPGDELWFEAHYLHARESLAVVLAMGFAQGELIHDLSGNARFIRARR